MQSTVSLSDYDSVVYPAQNTFETHSRHVAMMR